MIVFDFEFILFRVTGGHLLGKSCHLGFPPVLFLFIAVSNVSVPFTYRCLWQDVEFACGGSFSLPFHLLKDISFFSGAIIRNFFVITHY